MSDLGFGGAAGVGRPFTIQDLFSAVSGQSQAPSTTPSVINQYLDEESDTVTVSDVLALSGFASITYDTGTWNQGIWT